MHNPHQEYGDLSDGATCWWMRLPQPDGTGDVAPTRGMLPIREFRSSPVMIPRDLIRGRATLPERRRGLKAHERAQDGHSIRDPSGGCLGP